MTDYISRTTKGKYKIIFETDSREIYKEIEEHIRKIIDRERLVKAEQALREREKNAYTDNIGYDGI